MRPMLQNRRPSFGVLASCLVLVACQSTMTESPGGDAPLRTDRVEYEWREDQSGALLVEIPFTYHNTTGRTVSLVNCNGAVPPSLEKWVDGEWVAAWVPVVNMCLSPPIEVAHGATLDYTLGVYAGPPGSRSHPQLEVPDPEGTYRLVWSYPVHDYDDDEPGFGSPLPLGDRVSNAFDLRLP